MSNLNSSSKKQLAKKLSEEIRNRIVAAHSEMDVPIPTAKELAEQYNVAQITANRALDALAKEGVIYRIKGRGSFVNRDFSDQTTTNNGNKRVVMVFQEEEKYIDTGYDTAFSIFTKTMLRELEAKGHEVVDISFAEMKSKRALDTLSRCDGIITGYSLTEDDAIHSVLLKSGKPVVTYMQTAICETPFHQVVPDIDMGFSQLAQQLAKLNSKRLFLIYRGQSWSADRINACLKALKNIGIEEHAVEFIEGENILGDLGRLCGYKIGLRMFDEVFDSPPCIVSLSDFLAFGLIDAAAEKGLDVGKDFFLASFDDLEGGGLIPFEEPIITSITFPREQISEKVVQLMEFVIDNSDDCIHITKVPTKLVLRKSITG